MRNVSDKICRENQNAHLVFNNSCYENRAVYEVKWKNIIEPERPQMTSRMRIASWIIKATNTRLEYVVLIAFVLQHWAVAQWLRYCATNQKVGGSIPDDVMEFSST
jgi:hypothetical protein